MTCFEAHLPGARHRDAGAIEKIAPKTAEAAAALSGGATAEGGSSGAAAGPASSAGGPRRIIPAQQPSVATYASTSGQSAIPHDILIVASKLKDYIRARSEMNTSASVMDILSDIVRIECDRAIDNARREGRKTVLDRDFKKS